MANVLYVSPFGSKQDYSGRTYDFDRIYSVIKEGLEHKLPQVTLTRMDEVDIGSTINPLEMLDDADVVVCDITTHNPNCLYELGYAQGRAKPTLLVTARSGPIPYDLNRTRIVAYDPDILSEDFINTLGDGIQRALQDPSSFVREEEASAVRGRKVFVSYSHKDKEYLDRLLIHLKPLESAGLIDPWVDTQLKAGDRWKQEIELALQSASVAIILVSADFLASDFVVRNELPPILTQAERGGTRIIPLIVKPCRFARDPNLSGFQSHNSPDKPLSGLPDFEREKVFDSLAAMLEESTNVT